MRRLNVNLLYSLHAVLGSSTLTQAAKKMGLTQPAMSMALRRLREHFNDEIVVYGDGTRPTALGAALFPRVSRLLAEIDSTLDLRLDFTPATAVQSITIAAPEAIELMFMSRVVPRMLAEAPGIDIRLEPFNYGSIASIFESGADVALVPEHVVDGTFRAKRLFHHTLAGLVCEHHSVTGHRLSETEYLAARHAALFQPIEEAMFGQDNANLLTRRKIVVRTSLYSMLPTLVIGTDLVVTTSSWLAQHHASVLPLQVVTLPVVARPAALVAQWQRHRDEEPVIQWIIAKLIEAMDWPGAVDPDRENSETKGASKGDGD